jgi:hypothetical protein
MCVDFTALNKACKKDDFPLERIEKYHGWCGQQWNVLTPGYVLRISPNKSAEIRWGENEFHHSFRNILFRENARRSEECRVHIFKNDSNSSSPSTLKKHSSICGWHSSQKRSKKRPQ